jgi:mRNA interferase MazF
LPFSGAVLADQIKSLDWRVRLVEKAGALPPAVMAEIIGKLGTLIGA